MKKLYYSYLTDEGKQLFKYYCVLQNISSFKMQNYFSGNYPISEDFINWLKFVEANKEYINFLDVSVIDNLLKWLEEKNVSKN